MTPIREICKTEYDEKTEASSSFIQKKNLVGNCTANSDIKLMK